MQSQLTARYLGVGVVEVIITYTPPLAVVVHLDVPLRGITISGSVDQPDH